MLFVVAFALGASAVWHLLLQLKIASFKSKLFAPCILCFMRSYPFYAPRNISGEHIVAALSVRPSVRPSVSQSVSHSVRPSVSPSVRPYVPFVSGTKLRQLKSDFETILQK